MRIPSLVLILALGLAACDSADAPLYPSNSRTGETTVALGQTASLDGLAVSFDAIRTDSRCPANADCVWAGEAIVSLSIDGASHDLRVADPETKPEDGIRVDDLVVFAIALVPGPGSGMAIENEAELTLAAYPAR